MCVQWHTEGVCSGNLFDFLFCFLFLFGAVLPSPYFSVELGYFYSVAVGCLQDKTISPCNSILMKGTHNCRKKCKWASFEKQLDWFCFTDLATLVWSYCSRNDALHQINSLTKNTMATLCFHYLTTFVNMN